MLVYIDKHLDKLSILLRTAKSRVAVWCFRGSRWVQFGGRLTHREGVMTGALAVYGYTQHPLFLHAFTATDVFDTLQVVGK